MRLIDADALIAEWYKLNNIGPEDCGARFVGYQEIARLINNAPSAENPKADEQKIQSGDLISRADAIEAVENNSYGMGSRASVKAIKALPSSETHEIRTETHGVCLISKDDAIEAVKHSTAYMHDDLYEAISRIPSAETTGALDDAIAKYVADGLMELPSADAVHGEWIYDHHNDEHTCSVCGRKALCDDYVGIDWQMEVLSDYCPSCGARMENKE